MPRELDFTGESGTVYRYMAVEDDRPPSPAGGNFLYVKLPPGSDEPEVLFVGETESLYRGLRNDWGEAREQHGATTIYTRLNVTGHVRRAEQADLVAHYKPVMNNVDAGR